MLNSAKYMREMIHLLQEYSSTPIARQEKKGDKENRADSILTWIVKRGRSENP